MTPRTAYGKNFGPLTKIGLVAFVISLVKAMQTPNVVILYVLHLFLDCLSRLKLKSLSPEEVTEESQIQLA